ncbi:CusA/CzcA family heavy metal efflux RND transporter [Sulfuricurvum sp.]|uniref:efflux RND transporter permease subunit n=1 Tax=Sulfuricurvum sp. TaxID=2025608 RepID=UPI00261DE71F|nr:CusA/CzcA family heavy metal efflux RND transporter [Sulfuricurvum sp.]MDD4882983.1 CusA/CzcA family heavy metal efflux RND transporter [Sulfuricurvum sp.]
MIERLIEWSLRFRIWVIAICLFLALGSYWAIRHTALDAIPDLSPPQVILQLKWKGQSPEIIEAQGTYPIVRQLLSLPDVKTVRGFSGYENALIYIIFNDNVDLYWARTRVLEQLSMLQSQLPKTLDVSLGPDASGVGWVFEYALVSKTKNLAELRTLQDYTYKYALLGIDGVSEVASVGGFVPTYQVTLNNDALVRYNLSVGEVANAIKANNNDVGGRIVVQNGYEWMVQAKGYLTDIRSIENLVVATRGGIPVLFSQIARIEKVPENRRGYADLNGQGEVVGGIVVVRYGEDVYRVIQKIRDRLASIHTKDVEVVTVYDRSGLIESAIGTLTKTLEHESWIVIAVIALFLLHLRSALIVLIVLPLTIAITFLLMKLFGIGSNIMSLGGIAIAVGTMVDASIIMIENAHKVLLQRENEYGELNARQRFDAVLYSSKMVGRPIFFALALVVVSFMPIFALQGQEGLLFTPLAFTKSFAMGVGALLSVTLVPVLIYFVIRGRILSESANPVSRFFIWAYRPILLGSMKLRYLILVLLIAGLGYTIHLYHAMGWEFMPMMDEQTLMYMPVTQSGVSIDQSKALTQYTDAIIKSFPEVERVFGKGGRADSATDPAPLGMIETIITLKPKDQWREGMSMSKLQQELDSALQVPGLVNSWTYPIRGRIDMLLSGIRTPLGIKLYGDDLGVLQQKAHELETVLQQIPDTQSVFADRSDSGYYIDITINKEALARYNLRKEVLLEYTSAAIGGVGLSTLYHGRERYSVNLRLEEDERHDVEAIRSLLVKTPLGYVPLASLAQVDYRQSAAMIKSEKARPVAYVYITPKEGISATAYKEEAQKALQRVVLPEGYLYEWAGQSEYLESAIQTLKWIIPAVLVLIVILIYFALREWLSTVIVLGTLPFALLGGIIYLQWLHFNISVAVIVGFLALLGVAAETAIVMIVYLQESINDRLKQGAVMDMPTIKEAIYEGAVKRVRPKLMTVFAILAGLFPIMINHGVGSEVMQRIAAPMIGGIVTSAIVSLIVIPIVYQAAMQRKYRNQG